MPILANHKMRLIITGQCNLDCFYCHNEGQAKEVSFISLDDVEAVFETFQSRQVRVDEVTISGGEPLLHPDVAAIVALAADVAMRVTMVSNGLLATPRRFEDLADSGLVKFRLGLDSLRPAKPRPSPGYLDQPFAAADLVAAATRAGLQVDLNVVITKFNRNEIGLLASFAVDRSVSVKFFEHVEVQAYGDGAHGGAMASVPHVPYDDFLRCIAESLGTTVVFTPDPEFGDANMTTTVGETEIRYCRYLCDFGLCWLTGTRLDAQRFAYNCMSNRGQDRLVMTSSDAMVTSLMTASGRPCRSRAKSSKAQ